MKLIKIYQLNNNDAKYKFMDYEFALQHNFSIYDYKEVYCGNRLNDYSLEYCFEEFNLFKPLDFKGHSLSVSDIVELNGLKYYCDPFNWVQI